jgi:HNH endonuclease
VRASNNGERTVGTGRDRATEKATAECAWKGLELKAHRVVWTAEVGPLPDADKWTIDHRCPEQIDKACCTPEHERLVPRGNNTRQRWKDERDAVKEPTQTFAIALFAGIDRPTVQQKAVGLDELRQLLSRFEVLTDKRRGRCRSPTEYAPDHTSRSKTPALPQSVRWFSTAIAYRPILNAWPMCAGSDIPLGRTRPQPRGGAWSFR